MKIIKEISIPLVSRKRFARYKDMMDIINHDDNKSIFNNVLVHPYKDRLEYWHVRFYITTNQELQTT